MGMDPFDVAVEVVVPLIVDVVVEVLVGVVVDAVVGDDCVVVVVDEVVVDVGVGLVVITNPQPCDGSFKESGSDTGACNVVGVVGVVDVVVDGVVVVGSEEVFDDVVDVVVGGELVVDGETDLCFESCSPDAVSRSATSTTERIIRSRQRDWGKGFGEFCICSSP